MSKNNQSGTKNFNQGGQIVDHAVRMFRQTLKRLVFVSLFLSLVSMVGYTAIKTTANERTLLFNYYFSLGMYSIGSENGFNTINLNKQTYKLKHVQVINSKVFIGAKKNTQSVLIEALIGGLLFGIIIALLIGVYIKKQGKKGQEDKFLRGGSLIPNTDFKKTAAKKHFNKALSLGVVPTLINTETIHFSISGAPGTGKSQTLKHLIRDIKKNGDRAIIYSSSTEFIREFYNEDQDVILNPLDDRSPDWSLWNEVQEGKIYHYDDVAASLIPDVEGGGNDPFWTDTARSLLSNVARKLKEKGEHSTQLLFDMLLSTSLREVASLVQGTAAATVFADGAEKTALSVRATLLSKLESFKFLTETKGDFSIRNWVTDEDANKGCVFISSIGDQHEVLKPLISCWVDIFASSILSLSEDKERKIWLIIDELPSLQKLKSLEAILAQSRKYGGCVVIGYQSYSKVEEIYGPSGAKTLSDSTATKLFYRSNDQYNAKTASDQLGRAETKTTNQSLSMGAHVGRDSISISETETTKEVVLPTEILNLNNLYGFFRLPGKYPVVSFEQALFKPRKKQVPGFVGSKKTNHLYMLEKNSFSGSAQEEGLSDWPNLEEMPTHMQEQVPDQDLQNPKKTNPKKTNPKKTNPKKTSTNKANDKEMRNAIILGKVK